MTRFLRQIFIRLLGLLRSFRADRRANVAILFGFSSVALALGVGAGLDLAGAYNTRQKLSQAAVETCQYSTRTSVINLQSSNTAYSTTPTNTFQAYLTDVNNYAAKSLAAQNLNAANVTGPGGSYFSATSTSTGPANGVTDMSMSYPTAFLKVFVKPTIQLHAHIGCRTASTTTQTTAGTYVLQEGFETSCTSYCFTMPSGQTGALTNPTTTFGSAPTYTGSGGFSFYVIGYCLEVDYVGVINATDPEKSHSAELDCDNSTHTAGNSSLSTRLYLTAGTYELRYFYRSRVDVGTTGAPLSDTAGSAAPGYGPFDPYYICGWTNNDPTMTDDLSWFNNTNFPQFSSTSAMRTNQMNVYLDATNATGLPPLHYTNYGTTTQQLAGSNLLDACVYSLNWVERSVFINVSSSGYFWLSFAADGQNDSYGAQIDNIRVCNVACPGSPQDNFPDTTPSNGYTTQSQTSAIASQMTSASWGWNVYTSSLLTNYFTPLCLSAAFSSCSNPSRTSDNQVLLEPGFYELTYQYLSLSTFGGAPVTGCDSTPAASDVSSMQSKTVNASPNGHTSSKYSTKADVNMQAVFLSFPGQTLTPNPGGAITTASPLIDLCYYSASSLTRKIGIQIAKPGYYDLAYYAAGTATTKYLGGTFGTFTGTAAAAIPSAISIVPLGSPYTLATSSNCPAVPVPNPQVGAAQTPSSGTNFTFTVTNPFLQGASATACAPL